MRKALLILFLLFLIAALVNKLPINKSQQNNQSKPANVLGEKNQATPSPKSNDCQYKYFISKADGKGLEASVNICSDHISLSNNGAGDWDSTTLDTLQTFPDLFINETLGKDYRLPQTIEVNQQPPLGTIIVVRTSECPGAWCTKGTGFYLITQKQVKRIFQITDSDTPGRSAYASIYSTNPTTLEVQFDLGQLGCGGCRYMWNNFYDWDNQTNQLVLANNKHISEFKKLKQDYLKTDSEPSNTTSEEAKAFLQAKKTIDEIISGKNLDHTAIQGLQPS